MVQGGRTGTGTGARQERGTADGSVDIVGETQAGSGWVVNREDRLAGRLVQVEVPVDSRAYVIAHGFWKRRTTVMFGIRIFNLNTGSYLCMTP